MSTSYQFMFLLLSLHVFAVDPYIPIDTCPRPYFPLPWTFDFHEDTEAFRNTLHKPWIRVEQHRIITTLANTPGFKIASAILQNHPLSNFIRVERIFTNKTHLFIPNCNATTIYINRLENEKEILVKNPGIIDRIRSERSSYAERLEKIVKGFDGKGYVTLSHPYLYSDEEHNVVVHGVDKGFGAMKRQINNLSASPPRPYDTDDIDLEDGVAYYGPDGFRCVDFPPTKYGVARFRKYKMKIEMVVVASVVPTPKSVNQDLLEFWATCIGLEKAIVMLKEDDTPYNETFLYTVYF